MALTPKQQRFVAEYLIDLNATQAAIRAGYSAKTASSQGERLLRNVELAKAMQAAMKAREQRTEITQDRVLKELAKLGFANMQDYMSVTQEGEPFADLSKLTRDQAAAITEFTVEDFTEGRGDDARDVRRVKFKLADKRAALVDIGKHLGMFKDKLELTGKAGGPVETVTRIELVPLKK